MALDIHGLLWDRISMDSCEIGYPRTVVGLDIHDLLWDWISMLCGCISMDSLLCDWMLCGIKSMDYCVIWIGCPWIVVRF